MIAPRIQSKPFIILLMAVMAIVNSNINFGKDHWRDILESDAKGYYAYLPAVFIYQDLNFGFFDRIEKEKYYDKNLFYEYRTGTPSGKIIDKYFCGTAICEALLGNGTVDRETDDSLSSLLVYYVSIMSSSERRDRKVQ